MSGASRWLRPIALGLLLFVTTLAALTARVIRQGEQELAVSDRAFDRGDLREATLHARRAATLYAPGAPHVAAAYARLGAVALGAEASGQNDLARQAFSAMRAAALESRHFFSPHEAELARANAGLKRLSSERTATSVSPSALAAQLTRDDAPRAPWVVLLGLGFVLFALGLGVFVTRAVSENGAISSRWLWVSVALAAAGAACWTLSIYRA